MSAVIGTISVVLDAGLNDSCYLKNKTCKSKLPPASKIPMPIAKKKGIQRKIEFEIT